MAVTINTFEQVQDYVLHLPLEDRSRLATRLLESLDEDDTEISQEWKNELDHRLKEIDDGDIKMIPHDEVMASLDAMLKEKRANRAMHNS
jgi:putative addiction module component (TIGR02574 family)